MIKTAKVIVCLYAGIVAANAMDENVIERETPDGMPNNIISAEVPVNPDNITVSDKEEQQYGAFSDYLDNLDEQKHVDDIDEQKQAPSTTIATIKNYNKIDQEESKVKEVDNKIDSEEVVPNTDNGQNKKNRRLKRTGSTGRSRIS